MGLASLAGINLYLTVLVTGLAIRFEWVSLAAQHESLAILGNEWIIGVAGVLFLVEFFADKIPWVDSAWDSVHTVVRPAGGILLALAALGELDPVVSVIAALLFGTVSLTTHAAKAGGRVLVNLSPEPVSNSATSLAEDGLVTLDERYLRTTGRGMLLVRAVAMIFDEYLQAARENRRFSKVI